MVKPVAICKQNFVKLQHLGFVTAK